MPIQYSSTATGSRKNGRLEKNVVSPGALFRCAKKIKRNPNKRAQEKKEKGGSKAASLGCRCRSKDSGQEFSVKSAEIEYSLYGILAFLLESYGGRFNA